MRHATRSLVCLVGILTMAMAACGGGGDGKCSPTDPTCGPPPVQKCADAKATNFGGPLPCVYPPANTRDTIMPVFAPADSFDVAPVGVFVDFISATDSVSAPYTTWYAGTGLSVPKGASGRLCVRGGEKYESRCWNVTASSGARFAAPLLPKCWIGRVGDISGQVRCLSRAQLTTVVDSTLDPLSFIHNWFGSSATVLMPVGVNEGLLPFKVMLAGSWTAADSALVAGEIAQINQSVESVGGKAPLVMAGRTANTDHVVGVAKLDHHTNSALLSNTALQFSNFEIQSCRITFATDGLRSPTGTAAHELMHCLGFGHTKQFVTRMWSQAQFGQRSPSNWFTADDIAGFQMAYAIRAQAKRINANLSFF